MSHRTGARGGREIIGFPLGNRQGRGDRDAWDPPRDGDRPGLVNLPPRGVVRGDWNAPDVNDIRRESDVDGGELRTANRSRALRAAEEWPPVEQEDTDDQLHQTTWWHEAAAWQPRVNEARVDEARQPATDTSTADDGTTASAVCATDFVDDVVDGW